MSKVFNRLKSTRLISSNRHSFSTTTSDPTTSKIIPCQRHIFDVPEHICYFNTSYMSPGLKSFNEAFRVGLDRKLHPWILTPGSFFDEIDEYRRLISQLFPPGWVKPSDISIMPSVSYAASTIAKNLVNKIIPRYYRSNNLNRLPQRMNIVLLSEQFPSNYYQWMEIIKSAEINFPGLEFTLRTVKRNNNSLQWTQDVINNIDENTILLTVPNVHWSDGSLVDIAKVTKYIKNNGFKPKCHIMIDVTQSLGCMPFDMKEVGIGVDGLDNVNNNNINNINNPNLSTFARGDGDGSQLNELNRLDRMGVNNDGDDEYRQELFETIDFIACAGYKWLLGPYTVSFMYTNPKIEGYEELEPLEYSWMNRDNARDFSNLVNYSDKYQEGSIRFDSGQKSNLQLIPIAIEGIKQILEWTPNEIYNTLGHYNRMLSNMMNELGLECMNELERGKHMMGVKFDNKKVSGDEILARLKKENVYASVRGNSIRIAPHLHCREEEFEKFANVLAAVLREHQLLK